MNSLLLSTSELTLSAEQKNKLHGSELGKNLLSIFEGQNLTPLFQPIIDLKTRQIFAHESLIRGPKNSLLHSPLNLLKVAEDHGCLFEIDWLARLLSIHSFQHQQAEGLLFLNVTVNTLMQKTHRSGITLEYLNLLGVPIDKVVIEITELQPVEDYRSFIESVNHYREMGFKVAIDDLGAGYNGLRIWSEIRPDFVKIDHHFVSNIHQDKDKYHFIETLKRLADGLNTKIVAEGVEQYGELACLENLGIDFVQGFLFKRPEEKIQSHLSFEWPNHHHKSSFSYHKTIGDMAEQIFTINPHSQLMDVTRFLLANPHIDFVPVIMNEMIYGVIWRDTLMSYIVKGLEYLVEAEQNLINVIDTEPLTITASTNIIDAAHLFLHTPTEVKHHICLITDQQGAYLGYCSIKKVIAHIIHDSNNIISTKTFSSPS